MSTSVEGADVHPYVIKMQLKMQQLDKLVNKIYDIADCNMVLTNDKTGDASYDLNLQFADKLDNISTIVSGLGKRIAEKATSIRAKVASELENKNNSREIQFIGEIEPSKKRIKTEALSSDDENAPPTDIGAFCQSIAFTSSSVQSINIFFQLVSFQATKTQLEINLETKLECQKYVA